MSKPKRTSLEKIQTLETKIVAKMWFVYHLTPSHITSIKHKESWEKCREKNKQGYVMPYIRDCLKEWREEGFIDKSLEKIPYNVKKKKGDSYILKNYGYRLNFEPLYQYCKIKHHIEFSPKEKVIISKILGIEFMRKRIVLEYPEDNIIDSIIKFYLKTYALPKIEILDKNDRKMLDLAESVVEKNRKREEELEKANKKKLRKQNKSEEKISQIDFERRIYNETMSLLCKTFIKKGKISKNSFKELKRFNRFSSLSLYITIYNKNPKLVSSINRKFKKALGILP